MRAKNGKRFATLLAVTMLALAAPAAAQGTSGGSGASAGGNWALGAAAGVLMPGSVYIEPFDWDTGTGFTANAAFDYMVAQRLSVGAMAQVASTTLTEVDVGASVVGLGATLKAHFGNLSDLHFRAGISLMYQYANIDVPDSDPSTGLGVGLVADLVKPLQGGTNVFGQIGFITQPSGGNDAGDTTWGPIFFLGVGAELAR